MNEQIQREVSCPLCGNNNYRTVYNFKPNRYDHNYFITHSWDGGQDVGLRIIKCKDCGFIYQNPVFKDEKLGLLYPESIIPDKITKSVYENTKYNILWNQIQPFLKNSQNKLSIDIGTRYGALPEFLSTKGFKSIGIEMNSACVNLAKKNDILDIHCARIDKLKQILSFYNRTDADLISMIDVIEHLTNPNEDFHVISSIQKKGQLLVLTTMFNDSIGGYLFGKEWYYIHAQHTLYFDRKTIRAFLKKHGYEVVRINHVPLYKSATHLPGEIVKYIKHKVQLLYKPKLKRKIWFAEDRPHCLDLMTVIAIKK